MEAITLDELKSRKQWVCWQLENINGRLAKIPKNPSIRANAKSNDSTTWSTYDDALRAKNEYGYDGIGIMFSNGLIGIDIDAVGHGTTNATENPVAHEVLDLFSDTYIEKSPSGLGYHILGLCDNTQLPTITDSGKVKLSNDYTMKNSDLELEIYPSGLTNRFFTFTEDMVGKDYISDITDKVNIFFENYMKKEDPLDAIINKARNAKDGEKFISLFDNGDISDYNNDDSAADLALCSILAYYTNGNVEQIDKLFRRSALFRDPNLVYRRETLNPDSNAFVPYYTMRYIYEGKGYYLGAYGIGLTKSYGVPPDVTEKISKSVLRRIGNDRIGILALILGTLSLVFSFSLTSVFLGIVALALLAAGGIITYLFYRKYKAENLKELVKNSAERKKKYAEMFGKEQ